jgi:hypothetical protein
MYDFNFYWIRIKADNFSGSYNKAQLMFRDRYSCQGSAVVENSGNQKFGFLIEIYISTVSGVGLVKT